MTPNCSIVFLSIDPFGCTSGATENGCLFSGTKRSIWVFHLAYSGQGVLRFPFNQLGSGFFGLRGIVLWGCAPLFAVESEWEDRP